MSDKLYELKKDVSTPAGYWRAGAKKTEAEWRHEFHIPDSTPFDWVREWFIDISPSKEKKLDEIEEIVKLIFTKHQLHSISYRDAAIEACKECLNRFKMYSNF